MDHDSGVFDLFAMHARAKREQASTERAVSPLSAPPPPLVTDLSLDEPADLAARGLRAPKARRVALVLGGVSAVLAAVALVATVQGDAPAPPRAAAERAPEAAVFSSAALGKAPAVEAPVAAVEPPPAPRSAAPARDAAALKSPSPPATGAPGKGKAPKTRGGKAKGRSGPKLMKVQSAGVADHP